MLRSLVCLILFFGSHTITYGEATESPTLSVTGHGEVLAEPDQAVVQVGVRAEAVTARAAQQSVNATIQKVLDAFSGLAVDSKQIQTSQLTLHPVYDDARSRRESEQPRIVGYRASYTLSVKIDELARISSIVDTALEAGANQLEGVRFELKDEQSAQKEALRRAVADAIAKADVVAEAAGTRLAGILTIAEGGAVVRPVMMARSAPMFAEASGVPTPVMAGQVTVSGQVTIRYQISDR